MKRLFNLLISIAALAVFTYTVTTTAQDSNDAVPTIIRLVGHQSHIQGHIDAKDNIEYLQAGDYHLVLSNHAAQPMNLAIQNLSNKENIETYRLAPGESHISYLKIKQPGARITQSGALTTWQALNHF